MRKLKNYKPTKFKSKDSYYDKEYADFAVATIMALDRAIRCEMIPRSRYIVHEEFYLYKGQ